MLANVTVEVRITQRDNFGNAFTLSDQYVVDVSQLSEFAAVLVKLHEVMEAIVKRWVAPGSRPTSQGGT